VTDPSSPVPGLGNGTNECDIEQRCLRPAGIGCPSPRTRKGRNDGRDQARGLETPAGTHAGPRPHLNPGRGPAPGRAGGFQPHQGAHARALAPARDPCRASHQPTNPGRQSPFPGGSADKDRPEHKPGTTRPAGDFRATGQPEANCARLETTRQGQGGVVWGSKLRTQAIAAETSAAARARIFLCPDFVPGVGRREAVSFRPRPSANLRKADHEHHQKYQEQNRNGQGKRKENRRPSHRQPASAG
jgi:hypothetical protein